MLFHRVGNYSGVDHCGRQLEELFGWQEPHCSLRSVFLVQMFLEVEFFFVQLLFGPEKVLLEIVFSLFIRQNTYRESLRRIGSLFSQVLVQFQ
jgi:hypothetical protein